MIKVRTFINNCLNSNSYAVINLKEKKAVLVDLGDSKEILSYFSKSKINPTHIILTHEHYDHICGIKEFIKNYKNVKVICSKKCSKNIKSTKKNLSWKWNLNYKYVDPVIEIEKFKNLKINSLNFSFYPFEGHSEGGMLIIVSNFIFTGDQFTSHEEDVSKYSKTSIMSIIKSYKFLKSDFNGENFIFPGHGMKLRLKNLNLDYLL